MTATEKKTKKPSDEGKHTESQTLESSMTEELRSLNESVRILNENLVLIREHEFVEYHSSKWKIFAHQILLGILFAIGTVMGLVLLSWMTYTFFKDSAILKDVVDNQLKIRRLDLNQIREKAQEDVSKGKTASGNVSQSGQTIDPTTTPVKPQ